MIVSSWINLLFIKYVVIQLRRCCYRVNATSRKSCSIMLKGMPIVFPMMNRSQYPQWQLQNKMGRPQGICGCPHTNHAYSPLWSQPKLYIPSTIYTWKKVLNKAIWADKNGLVSDRLALVKVWGKRFKLPQLTHESFLTIDHSCKIFFWYLPNWTSTNVWCVVLYSTYSTTHQRSVEVQFGRYQKNILQDWSMVKNLSCVSCAAWNVFLINSLFVLYKKW